MLLKLNSSKICGKIIAPPSKSVMVRAIAAALLCANQKTILHNFKRCNDADAAINIINLLGAKTEISGDMLTIYGNIGRLENILLNCYESALCVNLFSFISTIFCDNVEICGEGTLKNRSMKSIINILSKLGLTVDENEFLPIKFTGFVEQNTIKIDGSGGSQPLSGLLMMLPLCNKNSTIGIVNLKSRPYIDLTISVLSKFGVSIYNKSFEQIIVQSNQNYVGCNLEIEGDWSGASCLLVCGAIGGSVSVENLNINSPQADKKIVEVLQLCGANVEIVDKTVKVTKNRLKSFIFNAEDCPDLFPAIVVLAANCTGTSVIFGAQRLKNKESDRAEVLKEEFGKLGISVSVFCNEMRIEGSRIFGAKVCAHNDHRIAMSLAAASINAIGMVEIDNCECVSKSYPDFWNDFSTIKKGKCNCKTLKKKNLFIR